MKSSFQVFSVVGLLLFAMNLSAQQVQLPPSHGVSAMGSAPGNEVNLYTGKPQITQPLVTFRTADGFTLPVYLSYDAGGHKVETIASWVGLGWSLNYGGIIKRYVKGAPDDYNQDDENNNRKGLLHNGNYDDIQAFDISDDQFDNHNKLANWQYHDMEPDKFIFSLNGKSGTFYLNPDGGARTVGLSNYLISYTLGALGNIESFEIKDDLGNTYTFGKFERIVLHSTIDISDALGVGVPWSVERDLSYNSSWFITKMRTSGGQEINFEYTTENYNLSDLRLKEYVYGCESCESSESNQIDLNTTINSHRLTAIESNLMRVEFLAGKSRSDLPGTRAITKVNVYSLNSSGDKAFVSGFAFNTSYFESPGGTSSIYKRLKLESIDQIGKDQQSIIGGLVKVKYNETALLPNRQSNAQDVWGYYNGNDDATSLIPKIYIYHDKTNDKYRAIKIHDYSGSQEYILEGEDRSPSSAHMKAFIIKSIETADGGEIVYEFEPHQYNYDNTTYVGGGLRVGSISIRENPNAEFQTRRFLYLDEIENSSGHLLHKNIFAFPVFSSDNFHGNASVVATQLSTDPYSYYVNYMVRENISQNYNGYTGPIVGYERVITEMPNGGKYIGNFSISYDYSCSAFIDKCVAWVDVLTDAQGHPSCVSYAFPGIPLSGPNIYPFPSNPDFTWLNGKLGQEDFVDSNGNLLKRVIYNYDENDYNEDDFYGIKLSAIGGIISQLANGCQQVSNVFPFAAYSFYKINVGQRNDLISKTIYQYDERFPEEESKARKSQLMFNYSPGKGYLTRMESNLFDGNYVAVEYRYPFDIAVTMNSQPTVIESEAYLKMKATNQIGVPIEELTYYKKGSGSFRIINGVLRTYQTLNLPNLSVFVPNGEYALSMEDPSTAHTWVNVGSPPGYSFIKDDNYELLSTHVYNTSAGVLNSLMDADGSRTDYTWGYNNSLITSETVNSEFTTTYTHIPLVGVETVTDPNGKMLKYEYDDFNRLRMVRDENDNILERYRYHYAGDDESITSVININLPPGQQSGEKNKSVSFSSNQTLTYYSKTKYVWDFGDGEVSQAFGSSASHIYNEVGTFVVKLTLINPDFDPIQVSRTICVTIDGGTCTALPD
ncbi:PKD domain-containing protein [Marinoscillum sp.]|uniref:PKD domain-containing protein n=1 Tax=Marinoscillum sp. TaxID=2024838 RepID=UPI003BA93534